MRLSPKTVYQSQSNEQAPGTTTLSTGLDATERVKSRSVSVEGFPVTDSVHASYRPVLQMGSLNPHHAVKVRPQSLGYLR